MHIDLILKLHGGPPSAYPVNHRSRASFFTYCLYVGGICMCRCSKWSIGCSVLA